jgi:hypothetical protein
VHDGERKRVLDLQRRDHDGNARGKTGGDRVRDVLNQAAQARDAHGAQQEARE